MQRTELIQILEEYVFSNSYLNADALAKKISLDTKIVKNFFELKPEEWGFIKDGSTIFFAHELIRANFATISEAFWKWYLNSVPSYSELAWEQGVAAADLSQIKIIPQDKIKTTPFHRFAARIVLLGEERVGKQSYIYALSGDRPSPSAPGVFFGKINRVIEEFTIDFESVILDIPANSPLWIYAKASFGVVLVYDLTNLSSFEKLEDWLITFLDKYSYDLCPPILILGNKNDSLSEDELKTQIKVADNFREKLEQLYGTIVLAETVSCTTGRNVLNSFISFAKVIRQWYQIIKEEYHSNNPLS